jgi:hypothetical protein
MSLRRRPQVEELGERILPSSVLSHHAAVIGAGRFAPPPSLGPLRPHSLTGEGSGTYTGASLVVDAGVSYTLQGSADLVQIGHVQVTGSVYGLGDIAFGHAGGTLVFSNAGGSVTVSLSGPLQRGFAPLPQYFQYQVVGGTGAYQHFSDHGSLNLIFTPDPPGLTPHWPPTSHGTFTLTIPGVPPPTPVSGINGQALVGPIAPVQRIGVPNTAPLAGAVIVIETADGANVVAQTVADGNGNFTIQLPPGHYLLVPLPPHPGDILPRGTSEFVDVMDGVFTSVTVEYDSGIR